MELAKSLVGQLRTRTFHYNWCNKTETDQVCMNCMVIVTGASCHLCTVQEEKKAESLEKLKASRAGETPDEKRARWRVEAKEYRERKAERLGKVKTISRAAKKKRPGITPVKPGKNSLF